MATEGGGGGHGSSLIVPLRREKPEAQESERPQPVVDVPPILLLLLVVAGGIAACFASGRPTGIGILDVVLLAALGALSTLAGWTAPWQFVLAATAVAAAAAHEGPLLLAAAAAVAAVLVVALPHRSASWRNGRSLLKAAAAATVCQVVLRLSWSATHLMPSAIAAGALLLVLLPGVMTLRGRSRRYVLAASGLVLLVAIGLTAVAGISALRAKASLDQAISSTRAGLAAASGGEKATALREFTTAQRAFTAANQALGPAVVGELVPGVSPQVRAVRAAVAIGLEVTSAARDSAIHADLGSLSVRHGVLPVTAIARLVPVFRTDESVIATALQQTGSFNSPWLVGPLRTKLDAEVSKLRHAGREAHSGLLAARVLPGLFGADGPRRYLVLFENPAESRASGGIVGEYGVLAASEGHLRLVRIGTVEQLNQAGNQATKHIVGPQDYIDRYSQFEPQLYWQNVPISPDFPSVGEVAANLFPQSGGSRVDGVISVDPVALQQFLKLTGPLQGSGWPGPIDQANVVPILEHQEFIQFASSNAARDRFLEALIRQVWHTLVAKPLPSLPALARELSPRDLRGHLQLYSTRPAEERYFARVGLAGRMPAVHGDFLGVVTQNAAGNKLDWYLRRQIRYSVTLNKRTDQVTATLRIKLVNLSPDSGLPPLVIAPGAGVNTKPGENYLYLSVYSPWQEQSASIEHRQLSMVSQRELGRNVFSALVTVPASGSTTVVVHLQGMWSPESLPYHLDVWHQPVIWPDEVHCAVRVIG